MFNPGIEGAAKTTVSPELVARKLAAIRNYDYPETLAQMEANPRLVELLWFLQGMSCQPGGLRKLAAGVLNRFADRIGTASLLCAKDEQLAPKQRITIWGELPMRLQPRLPEEIAYTLDQEADLARLIKKEPEFIEFCIGNWTRSYFGEICQIAAAEELPCYLASLCVQPEVPFAPPWYFPGIFECVLRFIDERAETVKSSIVMTAVATEVFEALDYAYHARKMIEIRGNSRFGKTQALRAWCSMWPGRARLVTVPSANSQRMFFRAIAEALGIDTSYGCSVESLQGRIQSVLRHSGLFLVFDESAFLIPQIYSKTTPPNRLNWVRTELFDRGLPVALGVTPQAYDGPEGALTKYARTTGYTFEQFTGRCHKCQLPEELGKQDLLKVSEFYFPEVKSKADLFEISLCALRSDNYLQSIQDIADRARFVARRDNRRLEMDLVREAITWLRLDCPTAEQPGLERASERPPERAMQPACKDGSRAILGQCLSNRRRAGMVQLAPLEVLKI